MSAPGEHVKLQVWRDRSERTIEAKLGGAGADAKEVADASGAVDHGQLGLSLRPLTTDEKREAKVDSGLVVEEVGGPAERAGIVAGDVLLAINGKPVQTDRSGEERDGQQAEERRPARPARRREDLRAGARRLILSSAAERSARPPKGVGRFASWPPPACGCGAAAIGVN